MAEQMTFLSRRGILSSGVSSLVASKIHNPQPVKPLLRKMALLVGQNYRGTDARLNGCLNDVLSMEAALVERDYSVTTLTDKAQPLTCALFVAALTQFVIDTHRHRPANAFFYY